MKVAVKENLTGRVSNQISLWVNKTLCQDEITVLKMKIGIQVILLNISKLAVILLISAVLGLLTESIVAFLVFALLRRYTFGLHAKTSLSCTLTMCFTHIAAPMVLSRLTIPRYLLMAAGSVLVYLIYRYAPSDTEKLPLLGWKKRKRLRNKAICCGLGIVALACLIPYRGLANVMIGSVFFVVIMILPVSYQLLEERKNNYEQYET